MGGALLGLTLALGCSSAPPAPRPSTSTSASTNGFSIEKARVLDLTYGFGPDTLYWPTGESFTRKDTSRGKTEKGYFYASGEIAAAEHGGTHLDAPSHFAEKGQAADEVPATRLVGPAWVLDARVPCAKDPDHLVSTADLAVAEAVSPLPEHAIVLVLTGWGRYWPAKRLYLGDDRPGKTDELSFPGIDPELARALVARKVRAVGIDTASIDRGRSQTFDSHQVFAAAGVPTFENVANLDALSPSVGVRAWLVAAPMKIEAGTGAPLRLFALAEERARPSEIACADARAASACAERLAKVAPSEAAIEAKGIGVEARIAPMFLGDPRREVDLEARLERAVFAVRFALAEGAAAWKAPHWPMLPHGELERGTPEQRMARYEDPERDAWQKPDEVVKALALPEDAVTVDIGVGSGYFARRLVKATPRGKAIGLDVEPSFVEHVNAYAKENGLSKNLEARLVAPDDPGLAPASVDLVLIVDTYHHLGDRKAYLGKLKSALKPGGRIVIIDFKKDSKLGPPAEHKLAKEKVLEEAKEAGLALGKEHDFLAEQYFIELRASP